jgi:hypothetical protein
VLPTLYTFNALPIGERASALWEHGTFIVASDHPEGRSAWYTFADYFVEVVMREGDFTKAMAEERPMHIAEVVPFYTGPRLERLLSVIDLAKL